MIGTALAYKHADLISSISNTKTFEFCFLTLCHRPFGQDCCSYGPCNIKMRRYYDILSYYLFEGSNYGFIICDTPLKENFIANAPVTDHFLKIIIDNGIGESSDKVFVSRSFLHK